MKGIEMGRIMRVQDTGTEVGGNTTQAETSTEAPSTPAQIRPLGGISCGKVDINEYIARKAAGKPMDLTHMRPKNSGIPY